MGEIIDISNRPKPTSIEALAEQHSTKLFEETKMIPPGCKLWEMNIETGRIEEYRFEEVQLHFPEKGKPGIKLYKGGKSKLILNKRTNPQPQLTRKVVKKKNHLYVIARDIDNANRKLEAMMELIIQELERTQFFTCTKCTQSLPFGRMDHVKDGMCVQCAFAGDVRN